LSKEHFAIERHNFLWFTPSTCIYTWWVLFICYYYDL